MVTKNNIILDQAPNSILTRLRRSCIKGTRLNCFTTCDVATTAIRMPLLKVKYSIRYRIILIHDFAQHQYQLTYVNSKGNHQKISTNKIHRPRKQIGCPQGSFQQHLCSRLNSAQLRLIYTHLAQSPNRFKVRRGRQRGGGRGRIPVAIFKVTNSFAELSRSVAFREFALRVFQQHSVSSNKFH